MARRRAPQVPPARRQSPARARTRRREDQARARRRRAAIAARGAPLSDYIGADGRPCRRAGRQNLRARSDHALARRDGPRGRRPVAGDQRHDGRRTRPGPPSSVRHPSSNRGRLRGRRTRRPGRCGAGGCWRRAATAVGAATCFERARALGYEDDALLLLKEAAAACPDAKRALAEAGKVWRTAGGRLSWGPESRRYDPRRLDVVVSGERDVDVDAGWRLDARASKSALVWRREGRDGLVGAGARPCVTKRSV